MGVFFGLPVSGSLGLGGMGVVGFGTGRDKNVQKGIKL